MVRRTYIAEQIINKLREAEIYISEGISISEASRKIGVPQSAVSLAQAVPARWQGCPGDKRETGQQEQTLGKH